MGSEASVGGLNQRAAGIVARLSRLAAELRIAEQRLACGTTCWDFGVRSVGGLDAGLLLARVCMAGLGSVRWQVGTDDLLELPRIGVRTDQPQLACMAAQYAGWKIAAGSYFAMGSGPMRAAAAAEPLFEQMGYREQASVAVGVLESSALPDDDTARMVADACRVAPESLCLLVAPTRSLAGTVQIVARSVETALHKLFELGYPLERVRSGAGWAPLPPPVEDDLQAIGRTNDAILYGATVHLWVEDEDDVLDALCPRVPSVASSDFGRPFAELFAEYDHDFYRVDKMLFSPARVFLHSVATGRVFRAGQVRADVLSASFGMGKSPQ